MKIDQRQAQQQARLAELRTQVESSLEEVRGVVQRQVGWAPRAGWVVLALLGAATGFALANRVRSS